MPARIESIDGQEAEVEMGGVRLRISLALTPEARLGDHVIVHTGYALSVMASEEAEETLRLLAELEESAGVGLDG